MQTLKLLIRTAVVAGIAAAALGGGAIALAQLPAPVPQSPQPVSDPSMVINDRGALLEVLPTQRATPVASSVSHFAHRIVAAAASAPIGTQQLGVVYNHALRQQGYITGEVTFKMKGTATADGSFRAAQYPGLRKLLNPNIYVVVAGTPAQFVQIVKSLQQHTDIEWVQPVINYGHSGTPPLGR